MSMRWTQPRLVAAFFAMTAVGCWLPVAYLGYAEQPWLSGMGAAVAAWYGFPALIAALILLGPVLKVPVMERLGLTLGVNRFWGIAWLTPMFVLVLALGLGWLFFDLRPMLTVAEYIDYKRGLQAAENLAEFDRRLRENPPGHPFWLIVRGLPASVTLNLAISLPMELGFRGFLFREMPGGFWKRSLLIGLLWGLLFVPTVLVGNHYPGQPAVGVALIIAYGLITSPILVYLRVRGGSVIPVALFQSMVLTLTNPALDLTFGGDPLLRPFYGASGLLAMLAVLGALYLHDRYVADQRLMPERARG